jgi:microcompartment protein CcmK/EutM
MILAQVVGTVVSSRKEAAIEGMKLMAVQPVGSDLKPAGNLLVAVDAVGAGIGETVLIVSGSSARYTEVTSGKPADASILAIVDLIETGDGRLYSKAGGS